MTTWVRPKRPDCLGAVIAMVLAITAGVLPVAAAAADAQTRGAGYPGADSASSASTIDASEDELVRQLVTLTDVARLQDVFTQRFIDRVSGAMSMFGGALDEPTLTAIRDQTRAVVTARINDGDALYSVLAPIYEKHFNLVELNQLVNFYESPLGQKLVRISPQLITEGMDLGSQWGLSLVPEIVSRVRMQLNGENPGPVNKVGADDAGDY